VNELKERVQAQRNLLVFHDASDLRLNALNKYESSLLDELGRRN
jgi:hypothetical protein